MGLARYQGLTEPAFTLTFGKWLERTCEPCDVHQVLSSFGVESHRVAKDRFGAMTVCDHGSTHISYQDDLLADEYRSLNLPYRHVNSRIRDRELREYQECDLITVPSSFARESFVSSGADPGKVVVVPYGVSLQEFRPLPKHDKVFRILSVAALSARKGLQYLLQAFAQLKLQAAELVLRGAIAEESAAILSRHRIDYRIQAPLPRSAMASLYSQASVVVLASVEDGFGLVIAQAMACGVPVIATSSTGAPDLFEDGREGFIVPPRDPTAIADRLRLLYEDPERRQAMGAAARLRVAGLAGWDRYGDSIASVYSSHLRCRHS
jgi:glycosyltransferase involved in cell wall biosynthesis